MRKLLLITLPLLLIVGCSKKSINYETTLIERDGLYTNWYENGQKKFERTFKDGKLVEIIGRWNEDGSVKE
jgi:antitoxin component YwqK of YwqJK toxin-antitoxin module